LFRNWRLTGTLTDAQRTGYPNSLGAFAHELLTGWWPDSPFHFGLSSILRPALLLLVIGVTTILLILHILRRRREGQAMLLPGNTHIPRATITTAKVMGCAMIAYGGVVAVLGAKGSIWPDAI